jgi:hypothetical protein
MLMYLMGDKFIVDYAPSLVTPLAFRVVDGKYLVSS